MGGSTSSDSALTPPSKAEVRQWNKEILDEALQEAYANLPAPQTVEGQFWIPNANGFDDNGLGEKSRLLEFGSGTYMTADRATAYSWELQSDDEYNAARGLHFTDKPITIKNALVMRASDYYNLTCAMKAERGWPWKMREDGSIGSDLYAVDQKFKKKYASSFDTNNGDDQWTRELHLATAEIQRKWLKKHGYDAVVLTDENGAVKHVFVPEGREDDAIDYKGAPGSSALYDVANPKSAEPEGEEYFTADKWPFYSVRDDKRIDFIRRAAVRLGLTPELSERLTYSPVNTTFELNGERLGVAGEYHSADGRIVIRDGAFKLSRSGAFGVIAHEIEHAVFDWTRANILSELEAITSQMWDREFEEIGITQARMEAGKQERIANLIDGNPYAKFFVENNPYEYGRTPAGEALIRNDGVSEYSAKYWKQYEQYPTATNMTLAINETLAEIARIKLTSGTAKGVRQGDKMPGAEWEAYYQKVNDYWNEYGLRYEDRKAKRLKQRPVNVD